MVVKEVAKDEVWFSDSVQVFDRQKKKKKLAENLSEDNSRTQSRKVTITSAKYESR